MGGKAVKYNQFINQDKSTFIEMDHRNDSENEMTHSIIEVKLEPFDEVDDYTQNVDPLEPDNNIHMKMEPLQDFKTEMQADVSDWASEEHILMNDEGDTEIKIEEQDLKTECFGNEADVSDAILDTCRIIQDNTSLHSQLAEKNNSTNTGEKNTTTYEFSHSCELQRSDVINEKHKKDGSSLNVTSPVNHSRARSDTCSSGVDVLTIHEHSTSEEEESKQSSSLIAHSLLHPSYVCDVCDMELKNSRNLVSHKVVHTNQKPHVCDVCKKGFGHSSYLVIHKRIHTGQKPYVCDICKKKFSRSSFLVIHKRKHTGEKPYICDICKKGFGNSSALVAHTRIHTGQKPYICDICKKGFSHSSHLVRHKRIHTGLKPYVCDICKKGFSVTSTMVAHKRIHTGEKPYICDICKKGFNQSSALVTHKRFHTGVKPYVCDICKKRFINSSNLVAHKRTHHGQKPCV